MKKILLVFILSMSLLPAALIVENGQPRAAIVLGSHPTAVAQFAAAELQHHILLMTGAALPMAERPDPSLKTSIYVGDNEVVSSKDFKHQEYLQQVSGNTILLCGRDSQRRTRVDYLKGHGFPGFYEEQGSLYAVYDFLERLGVRWYLPTEIGTCYTPCKSLEVPEGTIRRRPSMLYRDRLPIRMPADLIGDTVGDPKKQRLLNDRDRLLFYLRWRQGGTNMNITHSLYTFYPRFYKSHPEWFAKGQPVSKDMQLCLSNPQVIAQVVQDARDYFDGRIPDVSKVVFMYGKNDHSDCFPLGAMDNDSWCKCDECRKLLKGKATEGRGFCNNKSSEYWYTFVAKVAREVKKSHPDKLIASFAYSSYCFPPDHVDLPDNVMIRPATYILRSYSKEEMEFIPYLYRSWANRYPQVKKNVSFWYCFPNFNAKMQHTRMFPHFEGHHTATYFNFFREFKPIGMFWEPSYVIEGSSPIFDMIGGYLNGRFAWDDTVDSEAVYNEIFDKFYGPAAKPMKAFYDTAEKIYSDPANWGTCVEMTTDIAWNHLGTTENMAVLQKFVDEARRTATASPYKDRVELFNHTLWAYIKAGRKNADELMKLMGPSMQHATAPYFPVKAMGDCKRIPWEKVQPLKLYGGMKAEPMPEGVDVQVRLAHDGEYFYINYTHNNVDLSALEVNKMVWLNDIWEMFFARQRGVPYYQIAVDSNGKIATVDNNGIQVSSWDFPGRIVQEKNNRTWRVFMSLRLEELVPGGIRPGEKLYYNLYRSIRHPEKRNCVWIPTFAGSNNVDRLGEILLEPLP